MSFAGRSLFMAEKYEYSVYNGDVPEVRDRKDPKQHRHSNAGLTILVVLVLLCAVGFGIWKLLFRLPTTAADHRDGCYTFLVAGTDGDGTRTDTMMLVYLDTKSSELSLLSIPRDTLVDLNMTVPKLNGVYGASGGGEEGMAALLDQVELLLGYRPDGYVLVDFDAVEQIVDALGGVEFDVPTDMYYVDPSQDLYINLEAGTQTLTGQEALWVMRYRSGYALADLERVAVQREMVQAIASQGLQLKNVTKLPQLLEVYEQRVQSDLSFGNLVALAVAVRKCDLSDSVQETLPGEAVTYQSGSYYQVDAEAAARLLNSSFNPLETAITADDLRVVNVVDGKLTVIGGTGTATEASQTTETVTTTTAPAVSTAPAASAAPSETAVPSEEPVSEEPTPEPSEVVEETPEPEETPAEEIPEEAPSAEPEPEIPSDEPVEEAPAPSEDVPETPEEPEAPSTDDETLPGE
jgi:LCP family protein required for cell wall assembly